MKVITRSKPLMRIRNSTPSMMRMLDGLDLTKFCMARVTSKSRRLGCSDWLSNSSSDSQ